MNPKLYALQQQLLQSEPKETEGKEKISSRILLAMQKAIEEEAQEKVDDAEAECAEYEAECKRLREENAALLAAKERMHQDHAKAIAQIYAEFRAERADVDKAHAQAILALQDQIKNLMQELKEEQAECAEYEAECKSLQKMCDNYEQQAKTVKPVVPSGKAVTPPKKPTGLESKVAERDELGRIVKVNHSFVY